MPARFLGSRKSGLPLGLATLDAAGDVPDDQIAALMARDAEVAALLAAHEGAADPHPGYQRESEKGAANGYPSLDAGALVPIGQMPTGVLRTGSYVDRSAEGLNTTITPSDPTRPCRVIARVSVTLGQGANGNVNGKTDANATPTTIRGTVGGQNGNISSNVQRGTISFPVKAGEKYRFDSENLAGSPTFSLNSLYEVPE